MDKRFVYGMDGRFGEASEPHFCKGQGVREVAVACVMSWCWRRPRGTVAACPQPAAAAEVTVGGGAGALLARGGAGALGPLQPREMRRYPRGWGRRRREKKLCVRELRFQFHLPGGVLLQPAPPFLPLPYRLPQCLHSRGGGMAPGLPSFLLRSPRQRE